MYSQSWKIWLIINLCYVFCDKTDKSDKKHKYQVYEYGSHQPGEVISLNQVGLIPDFNKSYSITLSPDGNFDEFSYLRVECLSPISEVLFNFNAKTSVLTFYIKFPFIRIPYGVLGYSVPHENPVLPEEITTT